MFNKLQQHNWLCWNKLQGDHLAVVRSEAFNTSICPLAVTAFLCRCLWTMSLQFVRKSMNNNCPTKGYLIGTSPGTINPEVTFVSFLFFKEDRDALWNLIKTKIASDFSVSWTSKSAFEPPPLVLQEKCKCQEESKHYGIDIWMSKAFVWDPGSPCSRPGAATDLQ